ncbi:hypothetical protein OG389_05465 [Streptomyces sp. NBC_00435]|uniref:hypothetical protein n=1 Tax=Streptomyces sp. NBC_00435 TaxID=2903649 RepID=UPI002E1D2D58
MTRPPGAGPVSPLLAFGAILTVAGAFFYLRPGPGLPLLALGALVLAGAAAVWLSSRQH